uniref:Uncharacterized protein n=1 Tax=Timema genevievae TaxID=629358 RepID=A0A7R9JUE9_TIMGE|nr:unnamed protein product [Timema genevievae]
MLLSHARTWRTVDQLMTEATHRLGLEITFEVISGNPFWRHYSYTEKQRYDGWFNNLAHPDWGSVGKYRVHSLPS